MCYTTWDEAYIYLGFRIDCPDVQGTKTAPNADISGDDLVVVYIETDNRRAERISPACFSMGVSAAGGARFWAGSESGSLDPVTVWSFKYGATVQGTRNNSDDIDTGYSVEMAIPWDVMNAKPPALGDMMGFNIVFRRAGAKEGEFVSLSPSVVTEEDILNPSKWMSMVCAAYAFVATTPGSEKIVTAKSIVRPPLINGIVDEREWQKNTAFTVDLPMPAGFVYEAKFPVQRMALARYLYWYQADPRKNLPLSQVVGPDGALQLQDFPAGGAGPWFSCDRVQWHKEQLADAVAAGIDVVLPVYRGDRASRAGFAAKGLDCMVSAIAELRAEGRPYPMVGMFFDTTAMELAYGGQKPDLKDDEAKRAFYGMIRDFFDRVPRDFRAVAQAGKPYTGEPGCIVFLSTSDSFSGLDSSFMDYCGERFERDFGSRIVWVASDDFEDKVEGFDGVFSCAAGLGAMCDEGSRIRIGSVGAGFDNSAVAAPGKAVVRSRMGGETYDKDWAEVLAKNPQWIVCDSWNGFHEGSDLCASREYGRKYIEATQAQVDRFLGDLEYDAQYLRFEVPRVIPPRQFAQADFVIRNIGSLPWRAADGFALAYRWYRTGRFYSESKVRRPLERDIASGETFRVNVGIATVSDQGQAMPEGDYELRVELVRLSDNKWFSAMGDMPLIVPVTVGPLPEWGAAYLSCDAPAMVAGGQNYRTRVRVRNDGGKIWPKGAVKMSCKLYRASSYTHDNPDDLLEEVPTNAIRALLEKDCKPGEIAEFVLDLNLTQPNKKPVPSWKQDYPWSYQLRFDIYNGQNWLSEVGVGTLNRTVSVFDHDYGVRIADSSVPAKLAAGQVFEAKVVVRNNGVHPWDRKRTKIGYHWYHADGTLMQWDGLATPISAEMKPGWPSVLTATVKAPEHDGQYVLVWDVMIDDVWLSTLPLTRGGDILPVFVEVAGGRLAFADLGSLCDISAMSPDTSRTSGDFDGRGSSFPAELMPPDAGAAAEAPRLYPSGYRWDREARPDGRVSFLYPEKAQGAKSAVACDGQKVIVEQGRYSAIHLLAASSNGDASVTVSLNYGDGADSRDIEVSDWTTGPKHGEPVGCMTRHRHTHGGDEIGKPCYLYHYTIPLNPRRTLTSITLPKKSEIKVVAVTLERAAMLAP